jgi:hypothetical protein
MSVVFIKGGVAGSTSLSPQNSGQHKRILFSKTDREWVVKKRIIMVTTQFPVVSYLKTGHVNVDVVNGLT